MAHPKNRSKDAPLEPETVCDRLFKFASAQKGADECEAYVSQNRMTLARVETLRHGQRKIGPGAQQMMSVSNREACVRIAVNGAVGAAATVYLDDASLRNAVTDAFTAARMMSPDPNFSSLARPSKKRYAPLAPDREILDGDPSDSLARQVEAAVCCFPEEMDLAGSLIAISEVYSVRNSNGISRCRGEDTFAVASLTAERVDGGEVLSSGMGWSTSRFLKKLDTASAARQALELAAARPELRGLPEGDYDVILGPYSVADVINNMLESHLGLASIYAGTSWLPSERRKSSNGCELRFPKLGEAVAGEELSIIEDPGIPDSMGSRACDDEGRPTTKRALIEKGVWKSVLSNSYYAYLYGIEPPGNGFRYGARPGRMASAGISCTPTNLILDPGDMSFDEMVDECRGPVLFVPRTWYTYPTRYGAPGFSSSNRSTAFLIEKGHKKAIAPNAFKLRGDVSRVLKEIKGIGKEPVSATTWNASFCAIVPHILTSGIRVEKPAE